MKFDWNNYLELAKDLCSSSADEAKLRSSISRAYYAAFNRARKYLQLLDYPVPNDGSAHQYVVEEFENITKQERQDWKDWKLIGSDLKELREKRNHADYDDILVNVPSKAQYALKLAQNIIARLDSLVQ